MLTFFRKHQKVIFIFTTGLIILSFTIFGTGPMTGPSEVKEEFLVKAIDGSSVSSQKVSRMVDFLASSHFDVKDESGQRVNLLNDGILEKQIIGSSWGKLLAEKVMLQIQADIQKIVEKAAAFQSYRHVSAPFISAQSVWEQFSPEAARIAEELILHSASLSTSKKFDLLSQVYLQHKKVPTGFVRKILAYQEQQAASREKDASLPYADVSLLGLHSAKDWFGEVYLKAVAQMVINGAAQARKQGYKISVQEARQSLMDNLRQGMALLRQEIDPKIDLYQVFLHQARNLGMNEVQCIDVWKDLCLFRKMTSLSSLELDPAEIQKMSKEQALVEKFSLPSHLEIKDFSTFMKLQVYLDAISAKKRSKDHFLELPTEFLSLAEIEKKAPDLVQREYTIEYSELDLKKASSQISLKEMWDWQTSQAGWSLLQKQDASLSKSSASSKEERFAALESLGSKEHAELDKFSREHILASDAGKIRKQLTAAPKEVRSFSMTSQGIGIPLKGIGDLASFATLLEQAPEKGAQNLSQSALAAQEKMNFYTSDGKHYYQVALIKRADAKKVQTFAEANASGALRRMLDKKLEDAYFEVRKKDSLPYMKKDGTWKPLSEVREKVGQAVFAPILQAIAAEYASFYGQELSKQQRESSEFLAQNFLLSHMRNSLAKAQEGKGAAQGGSSLADQWKLVQGKETFVQKDPVMFALVEGAWSSLTQASPGSFAFFKVLESLSPAAPSKEELEKVMALLKREREKKLFEELFAEIEAKKAFAFPVGP